MKIEIISENQFHLIDENNVTKMHELPYEGFDTFEEVRVFLCATLIDNSINIEVLNYEKRQRDGLNAVNNLMSELRLNAIKNNYPREINKSIELAFENVTRNILLGWWISAKEECELVQIQGYVTQGLKDRVYNSITTYISNNY